MGDRGGGQVCQLGERRVGVRAGEQERWRGDRVELSGPVHPVVFDPVLALAGSLRRRERLASGERALKPSNSVGDSAGVDQGDADGGSRSPAAMAAVIASS